MNATVISDGNCECGINQCSSLGNSTPTYAERYPMKCSLRNESDMCRNMCKEKMFDTFDADRFVCFRKFNYASVTVINSLEMY